MTDAWLVAELLVEAEGLDTAEERIKSEFDDHQPNPNTDPEGSDNPVISNYRDGSALTEQGQLTDDELDDDTIAFQVDDESANITTNFSEIDTGDYTLNFEVADTDASASDSISVIEEDDADAADADADDTDDDDDDDGDTGDAMGAMFG